MICGVYLKSNGNPYTSRQISFIEHGESRTFSAISIRNNDQSYDTLVLLILGQIGDTSMYIDPSMCKIVYKRIGKAPQSLYVHTYSQAIHQIFIHHTKSFSKKKKGKHFTTKPKCIYYLKKDKRSHYLTSFYLLFLYIYYKSSFSFIFFITVLLKI